MATDETPSTTATSTTTTITRHSFTKYSKTTSYLAAGPETGPLLIFIHGWPALAETWTPQLEAFAALHFRCIAPDLPGYGSSGPKPKDKTAYSLQNVVAQLVHLLKHGLQREEAIWLGHDWGAGVVWALVAHHPEVCLGVVNMAIPYRTLEMGVAELVKYANRDIYPEEEYPYAQWAYQAYYESSAENFESAVAVFEKDVEAFLKLCYAKGKWRGEEKEEREEQERREEGSEQDDAEDDDKQDKQEEDKQDAEEQEDIRNKPAFTANVIKDGGWFGGSKAPPPHIPLSETLLSEEMLRGMVGAFAEHGFWAPTAYYLNHDINLKWCDDWSINDGVVSVPVLFVECLNDVVAGTYNSTLMDPMKAYCRKLTTVAIEAGHWVALERPEETNAAIVRWIAREIPEERGWPFGRKNPLRKNE
jgi:soluble epoxide hydrolase/lipid-phosphate phosphatase